MKALNLLAALFALVMLARHGRKGLLFLAPGLVRVRADDLPSTVSQLRAGAELEHLGFERLGGKRESGAAGGLDRSSETYANEAAGAFADVLARGPQSPQSTSVSFLSIFPDGATVLTANHRRLSLATDMAQTGGLDGADVGSTWAAHKVTLERFTDRHGRPVVSATLASALEASRRWYRGMGRRELRRLFALNFANAVVALLLLATSLKLILGAVLD